jgi:hypothetical protein
VDRNNFVWVLVVVKMFLDIIREEFVVKLVRGLRGLLGDGSGLGQRKRAATGWRSLAGICFCQKWGCQNKIKVAAIEIGVEMEQLHELSDLQDFCAFSTGKVKDSDDMVWMVETLVVAAKVEKALMHKGKDILGIAPEVAVGFQNVHSLADEYLQDIRGDYLVSVISEECVKIVDIFAGICLQGGVTEFDEDAFKSQEIWICRKRHVGFCFREFWRKCVFAHNLSEFASLESRRLERLRCDPNEDEVGPRTGSLKREQQD